ncbi:MAG TPA: hypothetical protein DDW50_16670 [Firmicutes bacterium]|nr:hypothetical protein [Bacillota bacterium]
MTLPCSIADLIPQKGKMSLNQTLIKAKFDDSESSAVITQENIFLDNQWQLSNSVLIEYINQLTAAVFGYQARQGGMIVQKGLFVGLQDAEFFDPVYLGDMLTLRGFTIEEISHVSFIQGIVERDGQKIAQLTTKLYQTENLTELSGITNQVPDSAGPAEIHQEGQNLPLYLVSNMHIQLYSSILEIHIGKDNIFFTIACPPDFEAFDGHFPGNPILPGVVLLEIATVGLEILLEKTISLKSIKKMKISGMVLPGQVIAIEININQNQDSGCLFTAMVKGKDGKELSRFNGSCGKHE